MDSPLTFSSAPAPTLDTKEMLGVEIPLPALQRGWLHSRELILPWNVERILEKIGDGCWFSHYYRARTEATADNLKLRPYSLAGFWPGGGLVELRLSGANVLDEHPRGTLCVHAATPAAAEALMAELLAGYRHESSTAAQHPRIGILNYVNDSITVERIFVTAQQVVPRERADLYYRTGAAAWIERWIETLQTRRYGLTVLTGPPGTGKTTLLRSLAHWLVATHIFYFMPASRFATVESGEIVSFWADENRNSRLRKILILEDAESILLRRGGDNREKVATLLNLTDGMLGDALGLHVVCTLNSDLADLDPALLRPGRLVAHRAFELLTAGEAGELARALGLAPPPPGGERVALAEVFNSSGVSAVVHTPPARRTMGFHAALASV